MNGLDKKKLIYLAIAFVVLIILAIILTIKPWVVKPKSVKAVKIGDINAYTPVLSTDSQDIYYYDLTALNLFKYNLKTNKKTQLSNKMTDIPDLLSWSPDRSHVFIRIFYDKTKFESEKSIFSNPNIQDGNNTVWDYNTTTQKITQLKNTIAMSSMAPEVTNPIWTTDSKKIVYYFRDQTDKSLKFATTEVGGLDEQVIGSAPSDIASIIAYDSSNKIIYYSTFTSDSTGLCQVYKFNITTSKKDLLFTAGENGSMVDDHRFVVLVNNQSLLYDITDGTQKNLPISVISEQTTINLGKTSLLANVLDSDREQFYIIDLQKLKIIKKIDPGIANTGYSDLSFDSNSNIFFVNNKNLFEIKN